jgi:hypothetical protein
MTAILPINLPRLLVVLLSGIVLVWHVPMRDLDHEAREA